MLETLPSNSIITVLDQNGDQKFEWVLAVTFQTASVEKLSPLTIRAGTGAVEAQPMETGDLFAVGQTVQAIQVADKWYIR